MSDLLVIEKRSTRHSKITGDFAEHLTLYLLSKHGFECARIDHTGMDLIARNRHTDELMGISVKSRSRKARRSHAAMNIPSDNFKKLSDACEAFISDACEAFKCVPYYSFIIDREDRISVYIMSQETLFELYPKAKSGLMVAWSMNDAAIERYCNNSNIYRWELTHRVESWWSGTEAITPSGHGLTDLEPA
jgi:hypothetical protein